MNLQYIFDAITPDNIKGIPLIRDAIAIFTSELEENAQVAKKIREIYNNEYNPSDTSIIQNAKKEARTALIGVYLTALHRVITKAQSQKILKARLEEVGLTDINLSYDPTRIISDEYFLSNKEFKEKIGTSLGIEYAYNFTKYLQSVEDGSVLDLFEIKPFHFRTQGTILKEMYEYVVKPLSHPLGFTYYYEQVIEEKLSDLYGIIYTYDVRSVEIRGLNGFFDVFTQDADDTNVKADFLTRVNTVTNSLFTLAEYNAQVTVWTNKFVQTFSDTVIDGRNIRSILFTDGTYIERKTGPNEILFTTYASWLDNTKVPIKTYEGHYSVYADYDIDYTFEYTDQISFDESHTLNEDYDITNTDNVTDTLSGGIISIDGMYLYSTDPDYLYTTDEFYLRALANGFYFYSNTDEYLNTTDGSYLTVDPN